MDGEIEKKSGTKILKIFRQHGEDYFRALEREVLQEIILKYKNSEVPVIVSTGGGVACYFDNMDRMNASGKTIYIRPNNDILLKRLSGDKAHRPLIRDKSREEIGNYINEKISEREKYYLQSHIIFNPVNENIDAMTELIREAVINGL